MWNPSRCFWVKLTRVVNSMVTLYGAGIIVYCLWLLKKWQEEIIGMPSSSFLARPLFIHICLAIGIALCLGTICGYVVANCFSDCMLCIYIVVICCLLLLEVAVVVIIYLRMDWLAKINKYIDQNHSELKNFVLFHLRMCRIILFVSLVPQISAIVLAIVRRAAGAERMSLNHSVIPDFRQSFLVVPNSLVHDNATD